MLFHLLTIIINNPVGIPQNPRQAPAINNPKDFTAQDTTGAAQSMAETKEEARTQFTGLPWYFRVIRTLSVQMWKYNWTPQSISRFFGPLGPKLVGLYTNRAFAHLGPENLLKIHAYTYHITAHTGSSEYAMGMLLSPGAYARRPLCNRLPENLKTPTVFYYGDRDWMNPLHAYRLLPHLKGASASLVVISDSGHHLYLDNPSELVQAIVTELKGGLAFRNVPLCSN